VTRVLTEVAVIVCIGSIASAPEKEAYTLVAEANQAFSDGQYAAALETYSAAALILPHSPELAYNQGAASYKLGLYAQAREAFNRSLLSQDVGLEARTKYNLGNVAYGSALKEMSNPPVAIELLKSAIAHYRDAIELDAEDDGARTNIELAQWLIRDLLEKSDQQREERRRQQGDQKESPEGDQDGRQSGDQQGGQREAGTEQRRQEQARQQTDDRLTPREVLSLLQAVQDKERERRIELARRRRAQRVPVAKDW